MKKKTTGTLQQPAIVYDADILPAPPLELPQEKEVYFNQEDTLRLELVQQRLVNVFQAIGLKQVEAARLQLEYQEKIRNLNSDVIQFQAMQKKYESEFEELKTRLSHEYGVDMKKIAYDDKTGKVVFL